MMHPFILGAEYRRSVLLAFVGSRQAQSGVIWGPLEPGCLICTSGGRHGKKVGYSDEPLPEGRWHYFGQGQVGDQSLRNPANAKLAGGERSILLFTTREPSSREIEANGAYGKLFAFRGSFNVVGVETVVPDSGPRNGDKLLRFLLLPADTAAGIADAFSDSVEAPTDLRRIQEQLARRVSVPVDTRITVAEYRARSAAVHRYALLRASGRCEACSMPAPFLDRDGNPYLEVHHILRLADYGLDAPANVAALCPNCHRAVHQGKDRHEFSRRIAERVAATEQQVSRGEYSQDKVATARSSAENQSATAPSLIR